MPSPDAAVFVSAHHDDAVLSCGGVIAARPGSNVITVFSSGPPHVDPLPGWDLSCGYFTPGDNVVAIRRQEDDNALALLGAQGQGLGLWPAQYRVASAATKPGASALMSRLRRRVQGSSKLEHEVTQRLAESFKRIVANTWLLPLGVAHPDHGLTTKAALTLVRRHPSTRWIVYEDLPYARESQAQLEAARRRVEAAGFRLEPIVLCQHHDPGIKQRAIACYQSQLRGLGDRLESALASHERYHELVRNPA
ncbi:MAG TPA: PIG-L family deacetylase [Solirubrobacteraceae bacterium]|nr:PIG-L family deacetylase [Solirubrobacteraceae bacterium]